ncbi:MAG: cob(I)yrinic acid a,c-diamide adenosyltransferase, partial [Gammaproteobacteria bacterium]|nr:cob(I)yrinic acid a,c-diamide adenosyltransferase [Gammaproteobacteria bacterium]
NHLRICALGDIDELNSAIGVVLAHPISHKEVRITLQHIQQDLFYLGGELCPPYREAITEKNILLLEDIISTYNATLPPLTEFILPGGNSTSALCHLARTICRRAERSLVALHQEEPISKMILQYINRLSDLLFVFARILSRETASEEIQWENK